MYVQIAPRCRVYISEKHLEFIQAHSDRPFRNSELDPNDIQTAKMLADKAVFVRKKLDNDVQYALNRSIRFVRNGTKK